MKNYNLNSDIFGQSIEAMKSEQLKNEAKIAAIKFRYALITFFVLSAAALYVFFI